jgi:quinol monooxygenase YgiN
MSHTVSFELHLQDGRTEEFLGLLRVGLADTRKRDGFEDVEVYVDADDPTRLVLWEKWRDRASHEAYIAWRTETGFLDALAPFVAGPPVISHLERRD